MKLTLTQVEQVCGQAIEAGFEAKFYQGYNSIVAYATLWTMAYAIGAEGNTDITEETSIGDAYDSIDKEKLPENMDFLFEMFNRVESNSLQEFYSLRSSIEGVKNFDEEQLLETMKQLQELQATESETLGKLKELI